MTDLLERNIHQNFVNFYTLPKNIFPFYLFELAREVNSEQFRDFHGARTLNQVICSHEQAPRAPSLERERVPGERIPRAYFIIMTF
jgi:hypothetical protein